MINQLHISTVDHKWTNTQLVPLNQYNINKIINATDHINCRTSPEDLSFECIHQALDLAVELYLVGVDFLQTDHSNFEMYGRLLNELVRQRYKIVGEFDIPYSKISAADRLNKPLLWIAGCSITFGSHIPVDKRFGRLVADSLDRPEMCLAQPGTSIFWAADQILRADLQAGDIVLWGLTHVPRVEVAAGQELVPVTISSYPHIDQNQQYWTLDWFNSPTQTLMAMHYIAQVQNFCRKIGVELYMFNMTDISWMASLSTQYVNYLDLVQHLKIKNSKVSWVDFGTDNMHPGPNQHQQWADQILKFIDKSKKY